MKKQNKKLRILAFCWDEPKLIEPYLNFINALSNCLPLKIIFITWGGNGKLAFLFKGHQVFTIKELLSLAENYNEDLPPIDLQDLVEYDKALNLKLVESPGSYNFDDYYRFQAKQILKAYNILWKTIKPNLVLTWNGFVSIQKVLTKLSKYYKIPVFYLERGLMPGKLSIYKEGINYGSEIGGDKWHKLNPPYPTEKEIILVKNYCSNLAKKEESLVPIGEKISEDTLKEKLNIPKKNRIIFLPLQIENDSNILFYSPHYSSFLEIIKDIQNVLKDIKNTTLIIKPHPENKSRIEEIKSIIIEKSRIVTDINIYSLLAVSDIVITVNSTVGLEALTLYKPVIVLGQAIYGNKGFTYDLKEKIELSDLIFQALSDANSGAFNERDFFRFFVYILKNILFNLDFNEDCWNSRNNILKNVIKEMKKNYDIKIKTNDAINEIIRSNSRYINIFNELKRENINEKMKSVFLKGFSKQTINFLLSSEKNNFIRFKCDYFSRSIIRIVTLLLRSSFKKYDLALSAEPLEGKSKIIWRLIRAKHKEIL